MACYLIHPRWCHIPSKYSPSMKSFKMLTTGNLPGCDIFNTNSELIGIQRICDGCIWCSLNVEWKLTCRSTAYNSLDSQAMDNKQHHWTHDRMTSLSPKLQGQHPHSFSCWFTNILTSHAIGKRKGQDTKPMLASKKNTFSSRQLYHKIR